MIRVLEVINKHKAESEKMIRTKDTDTWKYVKSHFPIIHLFRNVYLLRQFTYAKRKISGWQIVIVESEEELI